MREHLVLLAAGGMLIASGAWRAQWAGGTAYQKSRWLLVLSFTLVLAILTFFTGEFHPFTHPWAWVGFRPGASPFVLSHTPLSPAAELAAGGTSQNIAETLGISSILIQSDFLLALVLLLIRRWRTTLPVGWLTFAFGLNALGLSFIHATFWVVPVAGMAGIVADALYRWLRPDTQRLFQFRLFAAVVPVVLFAAHRYFPVCSVHDLLFFELLYTVLDKRKILYRRVSNDVSLLSPGYSVPGKEGIRHERHILKKGRGNMKRSLMFIPVLSLLLVLLPACGGSSSTTNTATSIAGPPHDHTRITPDLYIFALTSSRFTLSVLHCSQRAAFSRVQALDLMP